LLPDLRQHQRHGDIQQMSLQLIIGPLTVTEVSTAIAALAAAGINLGSVAPAMQGGVASSPARPPQMPGGAPPPVPGAGAAPPPPPAPAAPPAPANPRLDNVLRLMDAYSRAGHGVAGARKVLAQVQLSRAQDANEEQLVWLEQAFANTAWAPPG
jgi:hypothetical protein